MTQIYRTWKAACRIEFMKGVGAWWMGETIRDIDGRKLTL